MNGLDLWNMGVKELVCITPPGGQLSPNSKLSPDSMGKAPGRRNRNDQWAGYSWRAYYPSLEEVLAWDASGANIGVHAKHWAGFDIDIDDPGLAERIRKAITRVVGPPALVRDSKHPASILAYSVREPGSITKKKVSFQMHGKEQAVELLGDGQQWVAAGLHPSGKPYLTRLEAAWSTITVEEAQEVMEAVQELLETLGHSTQRMDSNTRREVDQGELEGDVLEVIELVDAIPNTFDERKDWIQIGAAIKGALPNDHGMAWDLFHEFSSRWEGGVNTHQEIEEAYSGIKAPYSLGIGYLRRLAGTEAQHDFDPVFDVQREQDDPGDAGGGPGEGGADPGEAGQDEGPDPEYLYSDRSLAKRFLTEFGPGILHAGGAGWYTWDGVRWFPDRDGKHVTSLAMRFLEGVGREAFNDNRLPSHKRESLASRCGSSGTLNAVLFFCSKDTQCAVDPDSLDADPELLNTPAGTVNLRTGELRPHNKDDLCTKLTLVGPKKMPTPMWDRFLTEITMVEPNFMDYLQRVAGYCATGSTREHALFFLHGTGGNGKGVFVNCLHRILGEYASIAPPSTFTMSRGESHPTDLAGLQGARMVSTSEVGESKRWDSEKVKRVTGGDPITARRMREDFFTFTPKFKILVLANNQPSIGSMDEGWRRRLHLLPFDLRLTAAEKDLQLEEKLLEQEGEGILHWIIQGAVEWHRDGLGMPPAVVNATHEYFEEQDPVKAWFQEVVVVTGMRYDSVELGDLLDSFQGWTVVRHQEGHSRMNINSFGMHLKRVLGDLGPSDVKPGKNPQTRRKMYTGIRIPSSEGALG